MFSSRSFKLPFLNLPAIENKKKYKDWTVSTETARMAKFRPKKKKIRTLGFTLPCNKYILLTKREGRTERISSRGLGNTDQAQQGPYRKDRGPIFSQYGPEQARLIRDLLHD